MPALNRLGVNPVGVFLPEDGLSPLTVLLRYKNLEQMAALRQRMLADEEFQRRGEKILEAPSSKPAYRRVSSSLMVAFEGMARLENPISLPGRIFQLRIYESPSVRTGQKKIEMFNEGELAIFRKTGLTPVFFGETLVGAKMPNLTYMLVFRSSEERDANWKRFVSDPDWKQLSARPEYADDRILSNITNESLKPSSASQI